MSRRKLRARLIANGAAVCCYCRRPLTIDDSTVEHIIPLSRGGREAHPANVTLACRGCNEKRGNTYHAAEDTVRRIPGVLRRQRRRQTRFSVAADNNDERVVPRAGREHEEARLDHAPWCVCERCEPDYAG